MIPFCRLLPVAALLFSVPFCSLEAQEIEQVTFYRDAAVVTWRADAAEGRQALARTLFPVEGRQAHVMPSRAEAPLGPVVLRQMDWSAEAPNRRQAAVDQMDCAWMPL